MQPSNPYESQGFRLLDDLFTQGKRVFNMNDIKEAARTQNIPLAQLGEILSNLAKRGRLLRLRRGLYVGLGLVANQANAKPFVISAYLIQLSAISHWSALQHHGLTEQVPQIITARPKLIGKKINNTNLPVNRVIFSQNQTKTVSLKLNLSFSLVFSKNKS
jgi:predicted transcriptional regulator of viral defense system